MVLLLRILLSSCIFLLFSFAVHAQEEASNDTTEPASPWKFQGTYSLNATQTSLSNWVAGGQNSISILATTSNQLTYIKNRTQWVSNLDMAYGLLKQDQNRDWWKTDDRFDISTKLGYKAYKKTLLHGRGQLPYPICTRVRLPQ